MACLNGCHSRGVSRATCRAPFLATIAIVAASLSAAAPPPYRDDSPQLHHLTVRASAVDPRAQPHPEIEFTFEKDGKPQDVEHAVVDTRVPPRGELVVWLMGYNAGLFERLAAYGMHAVQPHYANRWFGIVKPTDRLARGLIRLEAATGDDVSPQVGIPKPDGMMERVRMQLRWLVKEHPQGCWEQFLSADQSEVLWEKVIVAGASHGSSTAARFAKEVKVARVVMLCGPRDQDQDWQALPSATPAERFFGFSHLLDAGWTRDHYCRSWALLGLVDFGDIVNVDDATPPYGNSRQLVSGADVGGDVNRAHSAVQPGGASPQAADGSFRYEPVWRYLFTHPVTEFGKPATPAADCRMDHPD